MSEDEALVKGRPRRRAVQARVIARRLRGSPGVLRQCDGNTRLISRNRFRLPTLAARIGMLPMEPGSLVMERKMLLGIKQRAEKLSTDGTL